MSAIQSTPAELVDAIYTDFSRWAEERRGRVHIARDIEHALTLIDNTPAGWTAVLHWQGEDPAGTGLRQSPVMENNLRLFVRANLGPTAQPDIALIRPTAACPNPMLDLVAEIRTRMLCYTFAGVPPPGDRLTYKGCSDQASVGSYLVAVYSLLFAAYTVAAIPAASDRIALTPAGH